MNIIEKFNALSEELSTEKNYETFVSKLLKGAFKILDEEPSLSPTEKTTAMKMLITSFMTEIAANMNQDINDPIHREILDGSIQAIEDYPFK